MSLWSSLPLIRGSAAIVRIANSLPTKEEGGSRCGSRSVARDQSRGRGPLAEPRDGAEGRSRAKRRRRLGLFRRRGQHPQRLAPLTARVRQMLAILGPVLPPLLLELVPQRGRPLERLMRRLEPLVDRVADGGGRRQPLGTLHRRLQAGALD